MFNKKRIAVFIIFILLMYFMTLFGGSPTQTTPVATRDVVFTDSYDGSNISEQKVEVGKAATVPENPYHRNFVFAGWYQYDDHDVKVEKFDKIMEDTHVIALYKADRNNNGIPDDEDIHYTVRFVDSLDNKVLKTESVLVGMNATAPMVVAHANYNFTGWDKAYTNVRSDLTVSALFRLINNNEEENNEEEPVMYKVTFVDGEDNKVISTVSVESGKSAGTPTPPTHEGRVFDHWDGSYTNVTSDRTVTAIYEDDKNHNNIPDPLDEKHTVEFKSVGRGVLEGQTRYENILDGLTFEEAGIEVPTIVPDEFYESKGWDSEFASKITSDLVYTLTFGPINDNNGPQGKGDDIADEEQEYKITIYYVFEDGKEASPKFEEVRDYAHRAYEVESPKVTGYEPDREVVTGTIDSEHYLSKEETVTYKPSTNTPYTIEYWTKDLSEDSDEEVGYSKEQTEPKTGTTGDPVDLGDYENALEGFTFEKIEYYVGEELTESNLINPNGNTVVKIYYTRNSYIVIVDPTCDENAGEECNTIGPDPYEYGKEYTLPEAPVREYNVTFNEPKVKEEDKTADMTAKAEFKWYCVNKETCEESEGKQPGETITIEGDTTIYAYWNEDGLNVTIPEGAGYEVEDSEGNVVEEGVFDTWYAGDVEFGIGNKKIVKDETLTGHYNVSYRVIIDPQCEEGEVCEEPDPIIIPEGEDYTLPNASTRKYEVTFNEPNVKDEDKTPTMYPEAEFIGYCIGVETCEGEDIKAPGYKFTVTEPVVVYTLWNEDGLNVTIPEGAGYTLEDTTAGFKEWKDANDEVFATGDHKIIKNEALTATYNYISFTCADINAIFSTTDNVAATIDEATLGSGFYSYAVVTDETASNFSIGTDRAFTVKGNTNAGDYNVTVRATDTMTSLTKDAVCKVTIKPLNTATVGTCEELTYDGDSHTLVTGGTHVRYGDNTGKDAKEYTVKAYAEDNYAFDENGTTETELTCSIAKKQITVTAVDKTMNYGENAPEYEYTLTGAIEGDTAVSGTATYTITDETGATVSVSSADPGEYIISVSGLTATSNYELADPVDGKLTINPRVTFNSNGGTGTMDPQNVTYNTATALSENTFERNGATFKEWNTESNGSGDTYADKANVTLTENLTLYAQWTITDYTISYDLDGGSVEGTNPTTYTAETDTFTLINPTRDGYTFAGWTGTDLDEATKVVTITKGSTGNRNYTATWEIVNYTISYDLAGGSVEGTNPTTYNAETDTFTLINPTKEGYEFAGWTGTDLDEATDVVTITKGSTGNRSYTATWEIVNYTISYDLAGGSVEGTNPTTYTTETNTFTLINPTRDGYTFAGWTGTDLTEATETVTITKGSTGNRSYTATWEIDEYTINYDLAGGSVEGTNPTTYTAETDTFTLINPTKDGYEFAGWTGTDLTEATETVTITKGSTGDRSYTATWNIVEYTITYDLADGTLPTGVTNPETYTAETNTFTLNNPTRDGYTFAGWTGTDLTEATETVTITKGSTGNRSYTATWEVQKYIVKWNTVFGSTSNTIETDENVEYGSKPEFNGTLPAYTEERSDGLYIYEYTFVGWKDQNGNYLTSDTVIKGNTTYTAQYVTLKAEVKPNMQLAFTRGDNSEHVEDRIIVKVVDSKGTTVKTLSSGQYTTNFSNAQKKQGENLVIDYNYVVNGTTYALTNNELYYSVILKAYPSKFQVDMTIDNTYVKSDPDCYGSEDDLCNVPGQNGATTVEKDHNFLQIMESYIQYVTVHDVVVEYENDKTVKLRMNKNNQGKPISEAWTHMEDNNHGGQDKYNPLYIAELYGYDLVDTYVKTTHSNAVSNGEVFPDDAYTTQGNPIGGTTCKSGVSGWSGWNRACTYYTYEPNTEKYSSSTTYAVLRADGSGYTSKNISRGYIDVSGVDREIKTVTISYHRDANEAEGEAEGDFKVVFEYEYDAANNKHKFICISEEEITNYNLSADFDSNNNSRLYSAIGTTTPGRSMMMLNRKAMAMNIDIVEEELVTENKEEVKEETLTQEKENLEEELQVASSQVDTNTIDEVKEDEDVQAVLEETETTDLEVIEDTTETNEEEVVEKVEVIDSEINDTEEVPEKQVIEENNEELVEEVLEEETEEVNESPVEVETEVEEVETIANEVIEEGVIE